MTQKLPISELFTGRQGEGVYIGEPSIFIRTESCNLRCSKCDTKFASTIPATHYQTMPAIFAQVKKFPCKNIVFTGGEPLLHAELIEWFILQMLQDYKITIETNCTIFPPKPLFEAVDFWSLSPKLPGMGAHFDKKVLQQFITVCKGFSNKIQLKFVIADKKDISIVKELLDSLPCQNIPIIFQPNNFKLNTVTTYLGRYNRMAEEIARDAFFEDYKVQILPQMHILCYGRRRLV